ncbi:MAG TPA: hypothetical protein VLA59_07600 [Patescibacteria group bacterium]|nr:hypothetical protein [Patescibacteria group bacterium]
MPRRPIFTRSEPDAPPVAPGTKDPSGDFALPIPDIVVPWTVTTSAGLGLFLFLVRRREARPEHPMPAMVVSAASAEGAIAPVTPLPPMRELVPPIVPGLLGERDPVPAPPPQEVGIPRWLRPSVREARFSGSRDARYERGERR